MVIKRLRSCPRKKVTFHWSSKIKPGLYIGKIVKKARVEKKNGEPDSVKEVVAVKEDKMCDDMNDCSIVGKDDAEESHDNVHDNKGVHDKDVLNKKAWDEYQYELYMKGKMNNPLYNPPEKRK